MKGDGFVMTTADNTDKKGARQARNMRRKNETCREQRKENFYPSIFNDVLAPAAQGPSSSNTAGVYRIASIARAVLDGEPVYLKVEMSEEGGFYDTFFGMDSDKACLAGILGEDLISSDLGKVYDSAEKRGLKYEFVFSDRIAAFPTEMGEFTVSSEKETIVLTGITMGGGEILISSINGESYEIKGMCAEKIMIKGSDIPRTVPSVYPLQLVKGAVPPFYNASGMIEYALKHKKALWQAAIDYERSLTGLTEEEIFRIAEETLDISYASIEAGHRKGVKFDGITTAKTPEILEKMKTMSLIPTGAADLGSLDALAVMEHSNAHGVIICMPTGGASGIIPAAIKNTSKALEKSKEEEIKALLTAGLIGIFYFPTHYHGALGCQAEVGAAASMAAAGLVSFLTDDPKAAEKGAVLAMQYIIGQVCDPVAGYTQIPCFIRNAVSVSVAMTCANYAVLGLDTAVSLDGMAEAVLRVGEKLREGRINDLGTCMSGYSANLSSSCGKCSKRQKTKQEREMKNESQNYKRH